MEFNMQEIYSSEQTRLSSYETSKVLRNTYALLAMTLLFSAATAGISMAANLPMGASMICSLVALGLIWFVLPRTANSSAGSTNQINPKATRRRLRPNTRLLPSD